jgi:hypothetical protein
MEKNLKMKIIACAIKHNGKIYTGCARSHAQLIESLIESTNENGFNIELKTAIVDACTKGEKGFLRDDNRFSDRYEAHSIVEHSKQLLPDGFRTYSLYSHWLDWSTIINEQRDLRKKQLLERILNNGY